MAATLQTVTRQNTQALAPNAEFAYQHPSSTGGPAGTYNWEMMNLGPGTVWLRWDGQDAVPNDPASLYLGAGVAYGPANTNRMAVATAAEETTITFSVN